MPGDCVSIPPARLCVGGPYLQREFVLLGRYVCILILTKNSAIKRHSVWNSLILRLSTSDFRLSSSDIRHRTAMYKAKGQV